MRAFRTQDIGALKHDIKTRQALGATISCLQRQYSQNPMPPKSGPRYTRPTHFICLPLVTEQSIPQLSESLAYFRSVTTPLEQDVSAQQGSSSPPPLPFSTWPTDKPTENFRLIPTAAHRPPGTFHLTLGTMNLSDPEDMDLALQLLQDIDYAELLREVEHNRVGRDGMPGNRNGTRENGPCGREIAERGPVLEGFDGEEEEANVTMNQEKSKPKSPLRSLSRAISPPPRVDNPRRQQHTTSITVSLTSLGTFPRPNNSRVFYAEPQDRTARLLPFGQLVRQRFLDAGLITETRPLVLHATVANLIYVKGRGKGTGRGRGRGGGSQPGLTVDAREILNFFNNGRAEASRRLDGETQISSNAETEPSGPRHTSTDDTSSSTSPRSHHTSDHNPGQNSATTSKAEPEFIWARDILIDRIRICKMGAEVSSVEGWGLEYKPIAEKVFSL